MALFMTDSPTPIGGEPLSLSLVIPTLNAGATLPATLTALAAPTPGVDLDVVVVDGGSQDETLDVAQRFGARIAHADGGRGPQLAEGARVALGGWLLFLHADTRLPDDWPAIVRDFAAAPANAMRAGYFRLALDVAATEAESPAARRIERLAAWRARRLGLPYGDQGLLLSRALYEAAGGFEPIPLMEDVRLVRRIGSARLIELPGAVVTGAERYRRDGFWRRPLRNLCLLGLHTLGVSPQRLARLYG